MKLIFAISALAALAVAQDINSIPDCGKQCINNMLGLAGSLGCPGTPDAKCLCANSNFANGLRDCSLQACGAAVSSQVVAYGSAYCANAGAAAPGGTTTTTGGSAATTSGAGASASSAASSANASASSAISSAASSASNAVSSVASSVNSAASSVAASASSKASSAVSSGYAMQTQAPLAGAAVLGLAALLL